MHRGRMSGVDFMPETSLVVSVFEESLESIEQIVRTLDLVSRCVMSIMLVKQETA